MSEQFIIYFTLSLNNNNERGMEIKKHTIIAVLYIYFEEMQITFKTMNKLLLY